MVKRLAPARAAPGRGPGVINGSLVQRLAVIAADGDADTNAGLTAGQVQNPGSLARSVSRAGLIPGSEPKEATMASTEGMMQSSLSTDRVHAGGHRRRLRPALTGVCTLLLLGSSHATAGPLDPAQVSGSIFFNIPPPARLDFNTFGPTFPR